MAACAVKTCPGNVLNQKHELGDNECGYLNNDGEPIPKNRNDRYHTCRRPYCARPHLSAERRDAHEADATHPKHKPDAMDFLCDWNGHAEAIESAGFCPCCQ